MFSLRMERLVESFSAAGQEWIAEAYKMAQRELVGQNRSDGVPFMVHVVNVAEIVALELGLMPPAIAAVFLHEASRIDPTLLEREKKMFGGEIISMAEGLNKISKIRPKDTGLEAENYRKLIVSYSIDPQVTLIKLADRLEVMRSLNIFPKSQQLRKATEAQLLYAPLAHQLGLYNLKSELEDLSFKYIDPESYRAITNKLKAGEWERKRLGDLFIRPLEQELKRARIKYSLKSRTKTAYSIYKKMQNQQIGFEKVADLFAIRIIIECEPNADREKELCWEVYSIVTKNYVPDVSRLRDWITKPKVNGYESLHTTVSIDDGSVVELQIRTRRMDDVAESGYASHWAYKGVKSEEGLTQWLNGVKKLLEKKGGQGDYKYVDFAMDEIFVFTPDGELRRLSAGASVLDFAFAIHTNIGIRCSGAKVNGKPASIREKLKTGDIVEVMSNKNQKPSADWLNYVVSPKARTKIRQRLKDEEGKQALQGRELLERRMANWKMELNDEVVWYIVKHYKYKTALELFAAIAAADIDVLEIKSLLQVKSGSQHHVVAPPAATAHTLPAAAGELPPEDYFILDEKLNNVGYKLSKCCNPIMGDDVFGFVSVKDGIKIHRINCPNAARLLNNYPYRIQQVKWRKSALAGVFQTTLRINAEAEFTIAQDIMKIAELLGIALRRFNISEKGNGKVQSELTVAVPNNQQLEKLIFSIKKFKGVKSVIRVANG